MTTTPAGDSRTIVRTPATGLANTAWQRTVLTLPRGLIFLASIWLIVSWLGVIGIRTPVQPSSATFTPGVRMMLVSLVGGIVIGWPLLRLSQSPRSAPLRHTLLDFISLTALIQVVIWPLRVLTPWSTARTALIDLTLVAYLGLIALIIGCVVGRSSRPLRALAMLACVLVGVLAPLIELASRGRMGDEAAGGLTGSVLSPFSAVWTFAAGAASPTTMNDWIQPIVVAAAAAAGWLLLPWLPTMDGTNESSAPGEATSA